MSDPSGRQPTGWTLAESWSVDSTDPVRRLARLWIVAGFAGLFAPASLTSRLWLMVGAALATHLFLWLCAYWLTYRLARQGPAPVDGSSDDMAELAALAADFGEPLGLGDWCFEWVGTVQVAWTQMASDDVDSRVSIARLPSGGRHEPRVTLGFSGMLRDGRVLVSFLGSRPLIPYRNGLQLFDHGAGPEQLWSAHRSRLVSDGRSVSMDALRAVELQRVPPSILGALAFLGEWTRSPFRRAGELGAVAESV